MQCGQVAAEQGVDIRNTREMQSLITPIAHVKVAYHSEAGAVRVLLVAGIAAAQLHQRRSLLSRNSARAGGKDTHTEQ